MVLFLKLIKQKSFFALDNTTHIFKRVFCMLKLTKEKKYSTYKSVLNTDM